MRAFVLVPVLKSAVSGDAGEGIARLSRPGDTRLAEAVGLVGTALARLCGAQLDVGGVEPQDGVDLLRDFFGAGAPHVDLVEHGNDFMVRIEREAVLARRLDGAGAEVAP